MAGNGGNMHMKYIHIYIYTLYIYYVQVILPFYQPTSFLFFGGDTIGSIEDHHLVELKTSEKNITKQIRGSHSLMFEFP
jgi:hypothetical protein